MSEGQRTTDVLRKINRPKPSFLSKVRNLVIGATVVGSGGAAVEATVHPVESIVDTTKNVAVEKAGNIQEIREGIVSFYNESAEVQAYNEKTAGKLNGSTPLSEGEQIFKQVKVIPAGKDFEERQKMIDEGIPVNVRDYPGTYTPNGHFTKIIGKLPQGTIVEQAILVKGTVPNATVPNTVGDWLGFVYKTPDSNPNEPGKIGYIYGIFGQPQTPTTPSE